MSPNAIVIAIMSAERYGLAGLHQLRGRVGRGNARSYFLLDSAERTERLDILCKITDGFAIAEEDPRMCGPGDLTGVAQSGESAVIKKIIQRPNLSRTIRKNFSLLHHKVPNDPQSYFRAGDWYICS